VNISVVYVYSRVEVCTPIFLGEAKNMLRQIGCVVIHRNKTTVGVTFC
jgi:hypothetical protein